LEDLSNKHKSILVIRCVIKRIYEINPHAGQTNPFLLTDATNKLLGITQIYKEKEENYE